MRFVMCYKGNYWMRNMGLVRRALTSTDGGSFSSPNPHRGGGEGGEDPKPDLAFLYLFLASFIYYFII